MNSAIAVSPTQTLTPGLVALQPKPVPAEMKVPPRKPINKDTCPVGLPETLDLTELAAHLARIPEARRLADKDYIGKSTKKLAPKHKLAILERFPASTRELEKLSSKHLRLVIMAADNASREQLSKKCFDSGRMDDITEIWLINRWARASLDKSISIMDVKIREAGARASGVMESEQLPHLVGEDAVIGGLASNLVGSGLDYLIRGIVAEGWVQAMYQDIYADGPHANKAAAAVYALASVVDCCWPLDLVYEHSPQLHKKHYGVMTAQGFGDQAENGEGVEHFDPLPFKLKSLQSEAVFNLMATRSVMHVAAEGVSNIVEELSPLSEDGTEHSLDKLVSNFPLIKACADQFERYSRQFRGKVQTMASATLKGRLIDLIKTIERMHAQFRGTFTEFDRDDNESLCHINTARQSAEDFIASYEGAVPGREAAFLAAVSKALGDMAKEKQYLAELLGRGQTIRNEVTRLATEDPLGNRTKISACYDKLEAMAEDLEKANDSMGDWAHRSHNLIAREIEAWSEIEDADTQEMEAQQSQNRSDSDVGELLNEAVSENADLASRNLELNARVESLEAGLAVQRNAQADEGMSEEVREAMQLAMTGGNALTPAQVLLLVKAVYPHTEILPTAWSSAHDALIFEQTDRLWETLSTLAGKYTDAIVSGTPDTEARKMFTAYEYAANESETTAGGHLRKHREFRYQGETVYFPQHLKMGVAQDSRKTIRVHFKIIDGVLVIAYCGGHRKL